MQNNETPRHAPSLEEEIDAVRQTLAHLTRSLRGLEDEVMAGDAASVREASKLLADIRNWSRLAIDTEAADKYRKKLGRIHPLWGNGSLMGRVGCGAYSCASGPAFQSEEFCACVGEVLVCLQVWRNCKRSVSAGPISQSLQEKGKSLPDFANCS